VFAVIVRTSLTGPFPRSETLVRATRDADRGRASPESVEEAYRETEREVLALERRLGLDPATGGYLRWMDLLRPFAEGWGGFSPGPLTRWFETNTFYRQPVLNAPPDRVPGVIARNLPHANGAVDPRQAKAILPGPYTFAGLLDNRSGETAEALVHRLGRLLAEEVHELRGLGYGTFQFQEPLLVVRPPASTLAESVVTAYRALADAAGPATSVVWTFFGDAKPVIPLLSRLPVSVVGLDLAETDLASLSGLPERRGIGLGCVDPRTTLVEDPAELARIARELAERLRPSVLWLGPGGPLDLLPWEPATRKLHVLPAAQQLLTGPPRAAQ
jgi:5-methyltetrahydropteroyltriglutamate--homocysteine methyltransferase